MAKTSCGCGETPLPSPKIDCGSGKRPPLDYDAYTDVYMSKQVQNRPEVMKRFVKTPLEDMSLFKDKQFEYARCHHVIEHVNDPKKACAELMRIAKRGTLNFPTAQAELLCGRYDHKWIVFKIADDHLLFISRYFTPPHKGRNEISNGNGRFIKKEVQPFEWKDSFKVSVIKVGD